MKRSEKSAKNVTFQRHRPIKHKLVKKTMLGKENNAVNEASPIIQKTQMASTNKRKRNMLSQSTSNELNTSSPPSSTSRSAKQSGIMSNLKKKGGKLIRTLTPPRHLNVGVKTPLRDANRHCQNHSNTSNQHSALRDAFKSESMAKLTLLSNFENANQYTLKASETNPYPFQLEIPSIENVVIHCKVCCIMENYFDIGGIDFDFSTLMPWGVNKSNDFHSQSEDLLCGKSVEEIPRINQSKDQLHQETEDKRKAVLAALCEIVDDIVVEGFFREYYVDENREGGLGRVEACVLSSDKLRRFIVCFRCSSDVQDCPVETKKTSSLLPTQSLKKSTDKSATKENSSDNEELSKENMCEGVDSDVNETFLKAYNISGLQDNIFTLLDRLTLLKPFSDVAITGHSFGAALATLASHSYASRHPATRIYNQVFGSPIVGGKVLRREIHSLPNLNLIRIERSTDPFVNLSPRFYGNFHNQTLFNSQTNANSINNKIDWTHVGHCLRLAPVATNTFAISDESRKPVDVNLYRFDKNRPSQNFLKAKLQSVNNFKKLKIGNEIMSYRKDLEKIIALNLNWVESFHGEVVGDISTNGVFA